MTGSDHYLEAEELLRYAEQQKHYGDGDVPLLLASAQVHATLALTAATLTAGADAMPRDWTEVVYP